LFRDDPIPHKFCVSWPRKRFFIQVKMLVG
jgi:hypothetical protein